MTEQYESHETPTLVIFSVEIQDDIQSGDQVHRKVVDPALIPCFLTSYSTRLPSSDSVTES